MKQSKVCVIINVVSVEISEQMGISHCWISKSAWHRKRILQSEEVTWERDNEWEVNPVEKVQKKQTKLRDLWLDLVTKEMPFFFLFWWYSVQPGYCLSQMHTYTHSSPPLIVPCSLLGDALCAICSLCMPLPRPPALCWVGLTICVPEGYHRKRTWLHANVHKHIYIHSLRVWSLAVLLCLVVLTKVLNAGNNEQ